jgi:hypothetical protein
MARLPLIRRIPYILLAQTAIAARRHWSLLEPKERADLARILRDSKGRPDRLPKKDRDELRRLVGKLEPLTFGRTVVGLGASRRGRK